jgi:O-succinylbenzoic acid--CoA ligase
VRSLRAIEAVGTIAFVDALRAAWDSGDAVLPVDPRLPAKARAGLLAAIGDRPVEEGDALVMATSGTTGQGKGVVLTHAALAASASATSARMGVEPTVDRWLACLPLAHVGGLSVVVRALLTGTPFVLHDGFDPAAVEAAAADCSLVSLVATALRRVDAARFRLVLLGGGPPPERLPGNVVTTYGMTETGSGVVYDGFPLDGVGVRLDGGGQILLRGAPLLRAYRSAAADVVPFDADGWFPTGDAGHMGDDGRLVVDGRLSELIISGGENVWPDPVEAVLRLDPRVAEVAVTGRPDPEWGQRVVAFVVPVAGSAPPTLDQLRDLVKGHLGAWAAPRQLVLVDALPRTALGKVRRRALA